MRSLFTMLMLVALVASCGPVKEEKALLKEAYDLQQKTIEALSALEDQVGDQQDSLKTLIEAIEENLFAIPGFELELPGHEGHDHGHERLSLTTEEILAVQKEMYQQVKSLQSTIKSND